MRRLVWYVHMVVGTYSGGLERYLFKIQLFPSSVLGCLLCAPCLIVHCIEPMWDVSCLCLIDCSSSNPSSRSRECSLASLITASRLSLHETLLSIGKKVDRALSFCYADVVMICCWKEVQRCLKSESNDTSHPRYIQPHPAKAKTTPQSRLPQQQR
jgi:hypothetical protein